MEAVNRQGNEKKELCEKANISATSIAKLGKGANVNSEVLLKICNALNCDVGDIMEFIPGDSPDASSGNV